MPRTNKIIQWLPNILKLALIALVCCAPTYAIAQLNYSISYSHDEKPISPSNIKGLLFHKLNNPHELQALANRGPYLFRIRLESIPPPKGLTLFIENEHLDTITLYIKKKDKLVPLARGGNSFADRQQRSGLLQFHLSEPDREYFLMTTFKREVSFITRLERTAEMGDWMLGIFFQLGVYYGICLMFFIFNASLFAYLKDRLFLYYCLFQFFIVCSILYADGLFIYLTSNPWVLNNADALLHLGMAISGSVFAMRFLGKPIKTSVILLCTASLSYVLFLFLGQYYFFLVGEAIILFMFLLLLATAIRQFNTHVHSRFFVLGYGVFIFFALDYFLLRKLDIYLFDFYLGQLKTGSLLEMMVLSIAIIYRFRSLQFQNDHFRKEIELKVLREIQLQSQLSSRSQDQYEKIRSKYGLTDRELEVLRGIADGLTNNQIAARIFVSVNTVKFHTGNIFGKLDVTNRTQILGRLHE